MSVFWLFVIIFANAWTLGLWLLPRLHRQSTAIVTLFVGALIGALNFAIGGAIHARAMASTPMLSMAVVFGVRFLLHTTVLTGFYKRPHGRNADKGGAAKWGAAALGGVYFAVVGLVIEMYVRAQPGWEADELYFSIQAVKDLLM